MELAQKKSKQFSSNVIIYVCISMSQSVVGTPQKEEKKANSTFPVLVRRRRFFQPFFLLPACSVCVLIGKLGNEEKWIVLPNDLRRRHSFMPPSPRLLFDIFIMRRAFCMVTQYTKPFHYCLNLWVRVCVVSLEALTSKWLRLDSYLHGNLCCSV